MGIAVSISCCTCSLHGGLNTGLNASKMPKHGFAISSKWMQKGMAELISATGVVYFYSAAREGADCSLENSSCSKDTIYHVHSCLD